MWTQFWDMHSGGGCKEGKIEKIYIEAAQPEATVIFYNRFGHNPNRVTCTCCGEDYTIDENESIAQLTGFHRECRSLETPRREDGRYKNDDDFGGNGGAYLEDDQEPPEGYELSGRRGMGGIMDKERGYKTLEQYEALETVLFIRANEIKDEERIGTVPEEGYVWQGD